MKKVKKLFYFSVICGLSYYLNAQVGIGTDNPKATLHIVPKSRKDPLKVEGLKEDQNESLLSVDDQGVVKKTKLSTIKSGISKGEDVKGILIYSKHVIGTDQLTLRGTDGATDIPGLAITYTPTVNCTAFVTSSVLPIALAQGFPFQGTVYLLMNGQQQSSMYLYSPTFQQGSQNVVNNYVTITRVIELDAETTYNFKLQVKSWQGMAYFNKVPYGYPSYVAPDDKNAMKSTMTILFYSR